MAHMYNTILVTTLHFRSILMRNIVKYFGSSAHMDKMMNDNFTLDIDPIMHPYHSIYGSDLRIKFVSFTFS
jgi:hypothetical protein